MADLSEYDKAGRVLEVVAAADLGTIAGRVWPVIRAHPHDATCECPVFEVIKGLQDRGYTIVPPTSTGDDDDQHL